MKYQHITVILPLFCALTFGINNSPLGAQVAIGSHQSSTEGLLLPHVELHSLDSLKMNNGQSISSDSLLEYTGLMVFNTTEDRCAASPLMAGAYMWNGTGWEHVGKLPVHGNQVKKFKDQEGKTFKARSFGQAGIWMIENLAVKRFADSQTEIPISKGSTKLVPMFAYVNPDGTAWETPSINPKDGYLYNRAAASKQYASHGMNQQQVAGDIPGAYEIEKLEETSLNAYDGKVQGICPNGWHLPTDREWNRLEKEIYNNPQQYSNYTDADLPLDPATPQWVAAWETSEDLRGSSTTVGHATTMISPCDRDHQKNITASEGGFGVLLTGLINGTSNQFYGNNAYFWTASAKSRTSWWYRNITATESKVSRQETADNNFFSVRCKKDTN